MIYDFRAKYCTSQIYTYFRIELYCLPSSFLTQRTRVFSSSCVILFDAQISLLSILVFILNDELMSVSCIFLKILSPTPPKLRPFGNKFPSLMATQTNWGHPRGSEQSGWYHVIPSFPSTDSKRRVGPRLVFGEPRQMLLENEKKKTKTNQLLVSFGSFALATTKKIDWRASRTRTYMTRQLRFGAFRLGFWFLPLPSFCQRIYNKKNHSFKNGVI